MALRGHFMLLMVLVLLAWVPATASSDGTLAVTAVDDAGGYSHHWSPTQLQVAQGATVTFQNPGEVPHGVEWVKAPIAPSCTNSVPVGASAQASAGRWSGTCTFSQAGTYTFYCTVHGPEMTGTITVGPAAGVTGEPSAPASSEGVTQTLVAPQSGQQRSVSLTAALHLHAHQRGGIVRGAVSLHAAPVGTRVQLDLLANAGIVLGPGHGGRVLIGRLLLRSPLDRRLFSISVNARARRALRLHHRLSVIVQLTAAAPSGQRSWTRHRLVLLI